VGKTFGQICEKIKEIPYGKVATYGTVAKACGIPKGAQMVGWALGNLGPSATVPWQRVVAKGGRLSITNLQITPKDQALWLEKEGVLSEERADGIWLTNPVWHAFDEPGDLV
jgi:methylated-DNA-protein-cysteine methyltransferase-like protein